MKHYFIADSHLNCHTLPDREAVENDFIDWLVKVTTDEETGEIFLMGDIFDFWYEFAHSVPKCYDKVLNTLRECALKKHIHFIPGNHDQWTYGYLEQEIGLMVHPKVSVVELGGKSFTLAHGHSLKARRKIDKVINAIFESKVCRWAFRHLIIPQIGLAFGFWWSGRTHARHNPTEKENQFIDYYAPHSSDADDGMDEQLNWVRESNISTDYCIMGHRHKGLNLMLRSTHLMILDDFFAQRAYAVYDDQLDQLEELT